MSIARSGFITTPDTSLFDNTRPFRPSLGGEPRTEVDSVPREAESTLHIMVEQQRQNLEEVQEFLARYHKQREGVR